jgi:hypothetical protein
VDPRPLTERPTHEVDEYRLFMQATIAHENAAAARRAKAN